MRKLNINKAFSFLLISSIIFVINVRALEIDGKPVEDPVPGHKWYVSGWGEKRGDRLHEAVDIVGIEPGVIAHQCVYASTSGKVIFSRFSSSLGNVIIIDHQNGFMSIYAHLEESYVSRGDWIHREKSIEKSRPLGTVGTTGNSDNYHLHYAVHYYQHNDPPTVYAEMGWPDSSNPKTGAMLVGDLEKEGYRYRESGETGKEDEGDDCMEDDKGEEDGDSGTNPGGDRPDDNISFATSNSFSLASNPKSRFYRLAPKKGKTYILYLWKFEKLLEERNQYFQSLGSVGTPDETYLNTINTKISEVYNLLSANNLQYIKERAETPDIAILRHGYFGSVSSLINKFVEAWRRIPPSFSPLWVEENPVMVIPTGGLYGMENSEIFKATLDEYVRNGGTLIVFAQQHGYDFSVLPTPDEKPLECYGWREDQSCHSYSMYVDTWHPVLSSTTKSLISSPIDGYFADYPSNSTVLLSRRINGMPAMLSYPYGEGRVVVTSMYEDWGYSHGQSTLQGRSIIRDLITWAKNPDLEIPEYNLRNNPDPEVSLNLEIKNISDESASKAKILWLDPDRNIYFEEEASISIPPGEETTIPVIHTFTNVPDQKLGIWLTDYILYDPEGNEIQPQAETDSGRFILSKPPTEIFEVSDLAANITVSDEEVCWGSQVSFQTHFTNRAAQDKRLHLWWDYTHSEAEYWGEVVIPADGTLTEEITIVAPYSWLANFWLHIFEENGEGIYSSLRSMSRRGTSVEPWTYVGSANKGIRVVTPSVELIAQADKEYYKKGEAVNTTFTLKSLVHIPFDLIIDSKVKNSLNEIVYEYSLLKHFEANESIQENVNFLLPPDAKSGRYLIHIVAILPHPSLSYEKRIEGFKAFFDVIETQLKSNVIIPSVFTPSSSNVVSFTVENTGNLEASNAYVELKLLDPDDQLVFQEKQNFSLPQDQSTTLNFNISLPDIKFGDYKLTYTVFDGEKISGPIEEAIPSKVSMDVAFDKDSYRMLDDINVDISVINSGKFVEDLTLNLKIPSFEYEETRNITLNLLQKQDFSFSTQVPTNIGSGLHLAEVTLTLPSSSQLKETLSFTVPESDLAVTSDKTEYSAGDNLEFIISNSGGVDAAFSYEVELSDLKRGIIIYQSSGDGIAQAGGTVPLAFTIPPQAADGDYYFKARAKDNLTNKLRGLNKEIFISGIKADLEVKTDKEIYLNTEDITLLSKVINSDKEIVEANLNLQVLELNKWKHYSDPFDDGIIDIVVDEENTIWFGTRNGVVKYDGINWTTFDSSNSGLAGDDVRRIAVDLDGNLWFGTWGSGVSKFDGSSWITYDKDNSGLVENYIRDIAVDLVGNLWIAAKGSTAKGVSHFDGSVWTTYDPSNSGIADDDVDEIAVDLDGNLWFGTWGNGVSKFDGSSWFTYKRSNSGLYENFIFDIAVDLEGNLWIASGGNIDGAVSRFDGTNWTTYWSVGGLASDYVGTIAVGKEGNVWFGTSRGASKFDGTNWTTYTASNSGLACEHVSSIAGDLEGNIWFGTSEGAFMLLGGMARGIPLWQKDISINQAAAETKELTDNIGKLDNTGKLYFEGKLYSSTGQLMSEAKYPFYVTESDTVLVFSPDKKVYRQGETVSIQGEVKNFASVAVSDLTLTIQKQSAEPGSEPEEVYSETFSIPAEGTHSFSFGVPSDEEGTYDVIGVVIQNTEEVANASDQYHVSNPHISATVTAPDVVGLNPFDITIELENSGLIEGAVTVNIQPSGFSEEIVVPAEEKKLVTSTQEIIQTTAFEISLTGDYEETFTKDVLYGLGAEILVTPQSLYPEGRVEIPVKVTNTGLLENQAGIDFTLSLNGTQVAQLAKSYYLPIGQFVEDTLGFDLSAGIYTLSWNSLYSTAQISFEVKPLEKMEMTAELGVQTVGVFPLNVNLTNAGFDDFSGSISVESEIYSSLQEVTLASGSSNVFTFSIIPEGIAEGEYNLLVKLLRLDNTPVQEQTVSLTVTKPQFALTSIPAGLSFSTGEDASFPFTLKNTGSQEGKAILKVEVMDMESAEDFYLGAGQEKDLSFAFLVPYDLPQGDYAGKYSLAQEGAPLPVQGEFRFNIHGIDIDVEAQLDKDSYTEGEAALLTLTVTNNSQASIDLFAKVNYRDYEGEQSFVLETSSFLDFSIPLPEITEEKVFYGIYHRDGRGIHLNDIYIYKREEGVEVLTDKQVYYPGETVNILIESPGPGLMRINAPGYEDEFTIDGSTSKSFTLPSDLLGGTYGASWSFYSSDEGGAFSGVRLFDVAGLKVVVTEASLDKPRYSPGETIEARLVFESNQDVSAQLKLWIISPEGDFSDAGSSQISLSSTENTIADQSTSFDSSYAGMHRLVYALYTSDDRLIVSGSEAFDCGGGVILGVSTEKRDYPLATEEVKTFVSLFGDGEAPLALFIDDEQIKTMTVTLSGVTTEEIVLQSLLLEPGTLGLRAELQKDNLVSKKETSFNYGSSLADLTLTGLTYESEALTYTIRADAVNQGLNISSATSIAFYEGDPDGGGILIEDKGIGALNSGESYVVEAEWSGQGKSGDRVIYAVVDSGNSVREFNEENNEASLSLNIPEIFHELTLDKPAYSAYEDVYITAYIINNKNTAIQGRLELIIINLSSMTVVWSSSEDISIAGPSAQPVLTNLYNYNLGPNPEGEYRITQILTVGEEQLVDELIFTVLKTEGVAGTFTLEPRVINPNKEEDVLVSIDLQNRGNVGIEEGSLELEIEKKETGEKVSEKQIALDLDVAESKSLTEQMTLNLAEGFYAVKLLFDGEILDEQELEAKVQIEYTKEESLAPRVLILANRWSWFFDGFGGDWSKKRKKGKNYSELAIIEEALEEACIYYKIETNPITQIRELHSGTYNIIILLDPMLIFSHIFQEIKERVWRGEGVIGIFTRYWRKDFIKELFGIRIKGWPEKRKKTIETYATPISSDGEFILQSDFVRIVPEEENLVIVGKTKRNKQPAITLNHYGEGRAVAFGFKLKASPESQSYEALKQILIGSFSYLKPQEEKDATISRLVPIELTFQNPASSAAQLKIEEKIPQEVKLISAEPEPDEKDSLGWTFPIEPSSSKNMRYEVELPDLKGEYQFETSIIKVEGETEILIDTSVLSYSVEKTVGELISETITEIESLPLTSYRDRSRARMAVRSLARIQNRDETRRFAFHKNLSDTLSALKYLEEIETADINHIRRSLVDLMLYYERRTVDEEKKMGLSSVVDLEKLR